MKVAENIGIYEREGLVGGCGRGDEWSAPWGALEMQWPWVDPAKDRGECAGRDDPRDSLRVWAMDELPAEAVRPLIAIDITPACVEHCGAIPRDAITN